MLTNKRNAAVLGGSLLAAMALTWLCWILAGWWALIWVPAIVLSIGLASLVWAATRTPHVVEPVAEEPTRSTDEAPEFHRYPISDYKLVSSEADYRFLFGAAMHWRPLWPGHEVLQANPAALASDLVVDRARAIAAAHAPDEFDLVRQKLTAALGVVLRDPGGRFEVWADEVTVSLTDSDVQRLHSLAELRKDGSVWEHQRDLERSKRTYLGEEVLRNPGSAVVWWLSRDFSDPEDAAQRIGLFSKLAAAANGNEISDLYRSLAADDIDRSPVEADTPLGAFAGNGAPNGTDGELGGRFTTLFDSGYDGPAASVQDDAEDVGSRTIALLDVLLDARDADDREMFVDRFTQVLGILGWRDLAAQVRGHYDVPDIDASNGSFHAPSRSADPFPENDARPNATYTVTPEGTAEFTSDEGRTGPRADPFPPPESTPGSAPGGADEY